MLPSHQTALGDAGSEWELYATERLDDRALEDVVGLLNAAHLSRAWEWWLRERHREEDEERR